jgi:hypothetical protein
MVFAKINDQHPGGKLAGENARLSGKILSEYPLKSVEIIKNGNVIPIDGRTSTRTNAGAWQTEVHAEITFQSSGWLCLRCTEDRPDRRLRFAHTAPWQCEIPNKPLRPTRQEKAYLIERVRREIARSQGILPDSAMAEYTAALTHFESLPVAAENED